MSNAMDEFTRQQTCLKDGFRQKKPVNFNSKLYFASPSNLSFSVNSNIWNCLYLPLILNNKSFIRRKLRNLDKAFKWEKGRQKNKIFDVGWMEVQLENQSWEEQLASPFFVYLWSNIRDKEKCSQKNRQAQTTNLTHLSPKQDLRECSLACHLVFLRGFSKHVQNTTFSGR